MEMKVYKMIPMQKKQVGMKLFVTVKITLIVSAISDRISSAFQRNMNVTKF